MPHIDFYILDVFTRSKFGGNQLAVYIDLEDKLDKHEMLAIAKEINFAESTFVKKRISDNKYEVRIFTTETEIPFAGHPTIGTAYIIAKHLLTQAQKEIVLQLKQGDIRVTLSTPEVDQCLFQMTQTQPIFLKSFAKEKICEGLSIPSEAIADNSPIQEISTGLPYIIIQLKDLKAMEEIKITASSFQNFLIENQIYKSNNSTGLSTSLFFFAQETYEAGNDFNTRMFCMEDGVVIEDAATGSANGCFLAYLLRFVNKEIMADVEQGFQMNRKSFIHLEGTLSDDHYELKVGGHARLVSTGQWMI